MLLRRLLRRVRVAAANAMVAFAVRPATDISAVEREYRHREAVLFEYLRTVHADSGRDVLALAASQGRYRADALITVIRTLHDASRTRVLRAFLSGLEQEALLRLATLLGDQPIRPEDPSDAMLLLGALAETLGPRALRKEGRFRLAELRVEAGETDHLAEMLIRLHIARDDIAQPHLLTANALAPFRTPGTEETRIAAWLHAVNDMFAVEALEPVRVVPGGDAPFDRIRAESTEHADGPLVTVIIPTYAPGPRLATAVESLLAQSHRALQILIMDDASPGEAAAALDLWAERDPRIEIVHLTENNGPYLARNIGVSRHARGEYITIHDDDDWSHPRKIELQVAQLEADRASVANMSNSIRASDDLVFGRINGNPVWTQQGLNSLMVRRSVFEQIGYWDVLNRSADAEFNDRIRAWTGGRIPVVGRVPLTFYRVRWDSLSAGEFHRGYMDPRRRWYFHAYLDWHTSTTARGDVPCLPIDDRAARSFSAPADLLGSRAAAAGREIVVDVAFAADFRLADAAAEVVSGELEAALSNGESIGILQLDSPTVPVGRRIHPRILRAARHERAQVVSLKDHVTAARIIVLDPTVLQFIRSERSAVEASSLRLEDRVRHAAQAGGALYDREDVVERAEAVFGLPPEVVDV